MKEHKIKLKEAFEFEAGGSLEGLDLLYHTSPREYREGDTVVWICHPLTGNSDPEDWWNLMVGKDKLIDPDKYFVVCVNMICSPYGSSCPTSINPATGKPFLFDFPKTTIRDLVKSNIIVRKHLGIDKIDYLIGPSIGGFLAYEWVLIEPDVVENAIFIATTYRVSPYLTAFNESQRMALRADATFMEGTDPEGGKAGLACARSIALISYRTIDGYNSTQAEQDDDVLFADRAASYQRYQGKKLVSRFDAYSYWYLTMILDSHNIGRGRGGVEKALSEIKANCTIICINSDIIFPPAPAKKAIDLIPKVVYREVPSRYGHDGFLIENDDIVEILKPLFKK